MDLKIKPISFKPEILARIASDLSLQRHLSINIRPSLRKVHEFKKVEINNANTLKNQTILGSSNIKCGNTVVFCNISGGLIEEYFNNDEVDEDIKEYEKIYEKSGSKIEVDEKNSQSFSTIYPIVDIERGRISAPTNEEICLAQELQNMVFNSKLIPKKSLDIKLGLKTVDSNNKEQILYTDETDSLNLSEYLPRKKFSFVLYVNFEIFGRTGPLFDLLWICLLVALRNVQLPRVYFDEQFLFQNQDISSLKGSVNTSNKDAKKLRNQLICDSENIYPLELNNSNIVSTTIGVINLNPNFKVIDKTTDEMDIDNDGFDDQILLCDIEGESEENSVKCNIHMVHDDLELKFLQISNSDESLQISRQSIKKAYMLSKGKLN